MTSRTGADAIAATLRRLGVDCVFGLPGTQNVALVEALHRSGLRLVIATSELSAAMMANGYYRASGRPGVLFTIPGPGFAWALPGVAEAALDSAALLHITSLPATAPGRHFQLQAIDQGAMAAPVTRGIVTITHADAAADSIVGAWRAMRAQEPGPVLVEVAGEVWEQPVTRDAAADVTPTPAAAPDVSAMAQRLAGARRCVLLLGQGCCDSGSAATQLAERLRAAVVTTTSGRGVVAEDHPRSLGFALAGNAAGALNELIEASDVVLALGCKFSHNGSRGFRLRIPEAKLIHVDASPAVLGANYPAALTLCADVGACMAALLKQLGPAAADGGFSDADIATWRARCLAGKRPAVPEPVVHGTAARTAAAFFAALRAALPRDACVVTDSGRHQQLVQRHFPALCPRGLIVPTNLQSMGFGVGAAIGAKLAEPARRVVALIGDGGLAMSGLELLTAVRQHLDLTVIVFVDGAYAAIRDQQLANFGHATGTEFTGPDCAALAAVVGAHHVRLDGDAATTLATALTAPGVTLVEVAVGDALPMHWTRAKATAKARVARPAKRWLHAWLRRR